MEEMRIGFNGFHSGQIQKLKWRRRKRFGILSPMNRSALNSSIRIPNHFSLKVLLFIEDLVEPSTLDNRVINGVLDIHGDHTHARMGTQMVSGDRCLNSNYGRGLSN